MGVSSVSFVIITFDISFVADRVWRPLKNGWPPKSHGEKNQLVPSSDMIVPIALTIIATARSTSFRLCIETTRM